MSFTSRSYTSSRALSVYGGTSGHGSRISTSQAGGFCSTSSSWGGLDLADGQDLHVSANEKSTMQNLNDRLASYLGKVRCLEEENAELEKKIKDWYASRTVICHDHSAYFATIAGLKDKIHLASRSNAKTLLDIDNAKLAAEDFKMKYENEQSMRMAVEADISGLRRVMGDMNLGRSDLEMRYGGLKDELVVLQRSHQEEIAMLKSHVGSQVNVSVDAAPSQDLNAAMTEIRKHYESVAVKNRKELEAWYQGKLATVEIEVVTNNEQLVSCLTELKESKNTLQRLQIELQSHLSMKSSLEGTLADTQKRYSAQLAGLQSMVTSLELQLSQLHANITHNKQEYDMLLDLKTRLELEIAEYRRLLDGEDDSSTQVVTKTIIVTQTTVDGKVMETTESFK
ncbi:keratin, type I cytoskeletal 13-like [Oncorhynchus keta]|uniref:keratin, type I cytoskeletal 13-like n=1 Tax=Oncorhynchus keta TaxID=8018 RepID=UPI0015FBA0AE|nr:keratin, type I cytoskeletal 13-like [Oncorhynchus keta]